jgi:hypothetical protein
MLLWIGACPSNGAADEQQPYGPDLMNILNQQIIIDNYQPTLYLNLPAHPKIASRSFLLSP